ncbi:hemin binding protein [Mesorhizobium ciceri biovar biserrulae WSM1271]|uniref:Hemin binding protein n=1 Tax=Mesorhizobium ciceri biovar biserrulae (strain HAMBI 2942 / LMG 23838 / WSM1271) TaxID=765698 RepID=E8TIP7_MESCW|nr:hemin binding protein [Mesorhizobium ciceri biovar biserrulae WSM1271]
MHIDFRFRSASAPLLWILLTTSPPAEANESTAVFCDPSRIASTVVSSPRALHPWRASPQWFRCDVPEPEAAPGLMRQLYVDRTSNIPALYGAGWHQVVEVKSIGPLVQFPEGWLHKGVLE